MSDMVPEILNAALDSLFTPKEPGEREYQGEDGLLYCRNCHTPVQCRVKLWGRDRIVPCLCRCQQEAMVEKKRQDELVERQRKIRQLKATGIQEKHLLEWNFAVAEDNKDIQMAKRYVEQWKKVKAENLGLLLWGDVGTGKSFVAACIAQVQRFIRLTNLIPEILDMVDEKKIAFNPAVELSYLKPSEQKEFLEAMDYAQASPSLSQAQRLKKLSQEGDCTLDAMCEVMNEIKKDELDHVTIKNEVLRKYFPKSYTPKQMQDTIIRLLEKWQRSKQRDMER